MPVIAVNADQQRQQGDWRDLTAIRTDEPVVIMIHGFRYSPGTPGKNPHELILSPDPRPGSGRIMSWPCALGFGAEACADEVAITYGWEAAGRLGTAYARAGQAGARLGSLISDIANQTGRQTALIGHSLGARVALQALRHADPGTVRTLILLAAAEFREPAETALLGSASPHACVLNITSRENDLFDFAFELLLARGRQQALGFGLRNPQRNWLDIQIDHQGTLRDLNALGFDIDCSPLRLSHCTPYMRRGLFDFYRTALRQPWALPLPILRTRLDTGSEPRWSRLLGALPGAQTLRS